MNPSPKRSRERRHEAGSAYLVALLALVVLSVMALSVISVSTTEMEVGSNERSVTRTFYAAEAGIGIGVTRAEANNCEPLTVVHSSNTTTSGGGTVSSTGFRLDVTPSVFMNPFNSNLSSVNENKKQYFKVVAVLNATASELRWGGADAAPAETADDVRTNAQKLVGRFVTFDPHDDPEYKCNDNVENIAKIKL